MADRYEIRALSLPELLELAADAMAEALTRKADGLSLLRAHNVTESIIKAGRAANEARNKFDDVQY